MLDLEVQGPEFVESDSPVEENKFDNDSSPTKDTDENDSDEEDGDDDDFTDRAT